MKHKYILIALLLAACFCSIIKAEPVDKELSKKISKMERFIQEEKKKLYWKDIFMVQNKMLRPAID